MRRVALAALVLILVVGFTTQRADAQIPGLPSVCDLAPTDALKTACELASPTGAIGTAAGLATGGVDAVTGGVASGIFDSALSWLSGILSDTVKSAMDGLGAALTSAPEPPIGADWFAGQYAPLMVAGIGICVFVLIGHMVVNMIRFKTAEIGRCFVMFLGAIFLTATAPLFIRMALQFADALTAGFASWGGADAGQLNDRMTDITSSISGGAVPVAGPVITIIVLMFAVVLVLIWLILLAVRAEILFIGTLAIPFVLPSIIDGKARFARIYTKTMFGVIISKPILIGTFCFGAALIHNGGISQDGIWSLVGGIAIIGAATFLPLVVIKFLWPAAAPVVAVVERGGARVVSGVKSAGMVAAGAVTGGAAGAAMAGVSASSIPHQSPPRPRAAPVSQPEPQPAPLPAPQPRGDTT